MACRLKAVREPTCRLRSAQGSLFLALKNSLLVLSRAIRLLFRRRSLRNIQRPISREKQLLSIPLSRVLKRQARQKSTMSSPRASVWRAWISLKTPFVRIFRANMRQRPVGRPSVNCSMFLTVSMISNCHQHSSNRNSTGSGARSWVTCSRRVRRLLTRIRQKRQPAKNTSPLLSAAFV